MADEARPQEPVTGSGAHDPDVVASGAAPVRSWWPSGERLLFGVLLIISAVVRLSSPGVLEPNVSTAEVAHLATVEAILGDQRPSLLAGTGLGATVLALLPAALLRIVRPEPELALRLYAALGSIGFVAVFYLLCRSRHTPTVSLATTALLAFAPWSILFGRNGERHAFVGLWAATAALLIQRALDGGGPRRWLLAGCAATAGLYWHPSAIWILPAILVPVVWTAIDRPALRPRLTIAAIVLLLGAGLVAAPRVPDLLANPIATSSMLAAEGAQPDPPTPLRTRIQQTVRAWFLLDPTATGDARYQPAAQAPLDSLTGVLLLFGIVLAAWRFPARVLPVALLVIPLAGGQLTSARVPTLADAVVAMPGIYLLAAEAVERLIIVLPFSAITRAAILVAIPVYAAFGWGAYTGWIGSAASAQARQPALDYDEVDAWAGEQRARMTDGQPPVTARVWRDEHPRLSTGSRVIRRPRDAGAASPALLPARPDLRQVGAITGESGPRAARSVAAAPTGEVFVADATGRISRLDAERNELTPLQQRTPGSEQVSDLTADADGNLYLADADRSLLVKLKSTGELVGTLGADWGMYRPRGLGVGPDGRIYVADTGRNRIAVGTPDGRFQKAIVPPSSFGPFEQPTEVAVDPSGRIYVGLPEIGRLAILDESGEVLGGWAVPKGNTFESSRFAVVADGVIAITDPADGKLRLLDADGRELAVTDAPGRPYGVALAGTQLYVGTPATGRLIVYSLGTP